MLLLPLLLLSTLLPFTTPQQLCIEVSCMDTRGDGWNSPVCGDWGDEECTGEVEFFNADGTTPYSPTSGIGGPPWSTPFKTLSSSGGESFFKKFTDVCFSSCACYVARVDDHENVAVLNGYDQQFTVTREDTGEALVYLDGSDVQVGDPWEGEFCILDSCPTCGAGEGFDSDTYSCGDCLQGEYNELTSHRSGCSLCPAGTYNGNAGASSIDDCTSCPADTYSAETGRTQVSDCSDLLGLIHTSGTALAGSTVNVAAGTYDGASNDGINIEVKKTFYGTIIGDVDNLGTTVFDGKFNNAGPIMTVFRTMGEKLTIRAIKFYRGQHRTSAGLQTNGVETCPAESSHATAICEVKIDLIQCSFVDCKIWGPHGMAGAITSQHYKDIINILGCSFSGSARDNGQDQNGKDIYIANGGQVTVAGYCEAGSAGIEGSSLSTWIFGTGATLTGNVKSFSGCNLCSSGSYSSEANAASCTTCDKGKYKEGTGGTTVCDECGTGKYNDQTGAGLESDCQDCASGKYQPSTAAVSPYDCANCDAGKYSPSAALSECTDCSTGKYSAEMSSDCVECPPGTYTGSTSSIDCTGCEVGRYAGSTGFSACNPCEEGKFTDVTHSNSCTACDGGKMSVLNRLSCSDCDTGKYATPGSFSCTLCPPGFYPSDSAGYCQPCDAGTRSAEDGSGCVACPGGTFSSVAADVCIDCEPGKFSQGFGSEVCSFCDLVVLGSTTLENTISNSPDACICMGGFYNDILAKKCTSIEKLSNSANHAGVSEEKPGMDTMTLDIAPNFWRVSTNSTEVWECWTPEVCIGGLTLDNNNGSLCADGHYGPFCAVCMPNYAPSKGQCVKCTGDARTTVIMGVLALITGLALAVVGCWKLKTTDEEITVEKQEAFFKKVKKKVAKAKAAVMKVKIQGKIVLSYFQIATGLSFNFNLHFPVSFTNIMNSVQIINFDFGSYMPINCMVEMNYLTSLYGMTLFSLALMFALYAGSKVLATKSKSGVTPVNGGGNTTEVGRRLTVSPPAADPKRGKTDWSSLLFNNLLLFTFLILPSISTKIIYTFACLPLTDDDGEVDYEDGAALPINLNEGTFLKADYSIRCDSEERKAAMGYAAVMLLIFLSDKDGEVYYLWPERDLEAEAQHSGKEKIKVFKPIPKETLIRAVEEKKGVIVTLDEDEAMYCAMWMRDEFMKTNPRVARLKFLWEPYEPQCYWFECVETVRKLMLTSGLVFFNAGTASQIAVAIFICLFSMRVYAGYKPFIKETHDRLAETAQWQLFLTLFGGLLIKVDVTTEDGYSQQIFGDVMAAVQFVIPAMMVYQMFLKKGKKLEGDDDGEDANPLGNFLGGIKDKMDDAGLGAVTNSLSSVADKMAQMKDDIAGELGMEEGDGEGEMLGFETGEKLGEVIEEFFEKCSSKVKAFLDEKFAGVKSAFTTSFKQEFEKRRGMLEDPVEASKGAMAFARGAVLEVIAGSGGGGGSDVASEAQEMIDEKISEFRAAVVIWAVTESGDFLDNDIIPEFKGYMEEQGVPEMLLSKGVEHVRSKIIAQIESWVGSMIDMLVSSAKGGIGGAIGGRGWGGRERRRNEGPGALTYQGRGGEV
ncbi:hypothetical protein TL16_g08430 [Triparma laevis f. inornata]|uniref:Tyrosine-protein kinase ephrin type A/B receptor-like domain-containing protein n=1 Tax=Triparma laevis f. inornata TaxID=1714386 RepID=A0A9W7B2Z3_9STRA|nr:hypothetical protein TL16_g08430 [Triparma laevis f. inornata]